MFLSSGMCDTRSLFKNFTKKLVLPKKVIFVPYLSHIVPDQSKFEYVFLKFEQNLNTVAYKVVAYASMYRSFA